MNTTNDVIEVAWTAGEKIWVHARGNPALLVAGATVAVAAGLTYGTYRYGSKLVTWFD